MPIVEPDLLAAGRSAAPVDGTAHRAAPFEYQPALDGLRALAVTAVLLYHGNVVWARGGFLGVDAFFVLSGYLITSLLLIEHARQGRIALRAFWARRARRLLPALFAVLVAVALYGAFLAPADQLRSLWSDGLATLFYVQNWHQILSHQSYFAAGTPSPLRHAWSLAIEEQWYAVWPVVLGVLLSVRGRHRGRLLAAVVLLAGASALAMPALYHGGDPSRVYYGTDTRAQSLLVGAALAVLLARLPAVSSRAAHRSMDLAALAALAAALWVWSSADSGAAWLYRGGIAATALLVALVIAAAVQPGPGVVRALLSLRPLVAVGLVSYGLYLWHWPVYVVLTAERTGLHGSALLLARVAVSFTVAGASYVLVERPLRYGGLARRAGWPAVPIGAAAVAVVLAVGTGGLVGHRTAAPASPPDKLRPLTRGEVEAARALRDRAYGPDVVRGVTFGDSVAMTMGSADGSTPATRGINVDSYPTVVACGIMDTPLRGRGFHDDQHKCRRVPTLWAQSVDIWRPNVVVLLTGAWEVFDHRIGGGWRPFGSAEFRAEFRRRLDLVLAVATRYGARLVILTTPCFDPPDTLGWGAERRDPRRIAWLNRQWREFGAEHPGRVSVLDLYARVCPGGRYTGSIDGRTIRRSDGVHFTEDGATYVWTWLAPRLRSIAPPARAIDRDAPDPGPPR